MHVLCLTNYRKIRCSMQYSAHHSVWCIQRVLFVVVNTIMSILLVCFHVKQYDIWYSRVFIFSAKYGFFSLKWIGVLVVRTIPLSTVLIVVESTDDLLFSFIYGNIEFWTSIFQRYDGGFTPVSAIHIDVIQPMNNAK